MLILFSSDILLGVARLPRDFLSGMVAYKSLKTRKSPVDITPKGGRSCLQELPHNGSLSLQSLTANLNGVLLGWLLRGAGC